MCAKDIDHDQLMKDLKSKTEENDQLLALLVSQQQLMQALDPSNQALEQRLREMEGAKKLADAKKAGSQAQLDVLKAKLGDFAVASYTGEATLKEGAGKLEAEMLAACASARVSQAIGERIKQAQRDAKWRIAIYPADTPPAFDELFAFGARVSLAETTMRLALESVGPLISESQAKVPPESEFAQTKAMGEGLLGTAPVAVAGLALETVDKLLSYFRADYTAGSITTSPHEKPLLMEIARGISKKTKSEVSMPCLYAPCLNAPETSEVVVALHELAKTRGEIDVQFRLLESKLEDVNKQLQSVRKEFKQKLKDEAKELQLALDRLKQAGGLFDSLVEAIFKASDGTPPVASLLKQAELYRAFGDVDAVLLVNLDHTSGSYYTKKSFLSSIGWRRKVPAYFSGGMSVSYALFQPQTGSVLDSGTIPAISDFVCMNRIKDYVASRASASSI